MTTKKRRGKPLTAEYVREILSYDPETGILRWRHRFTFSPGWSTRYFDKPAGFKVRGHLQIQIDGANYYAHRLAWLIFYGEWPEDQIDHVNGVRDDNPIKNLRLADNSENGFNKAMQRNNTSGFIGISFSAQRGMWEARIWVKQKCKWRGFFDTPEEADKARRQAIKTIHGNFAAESRRAVYPNSHR